MERNTERKAGEMKILASDMVCGRYVRTATIPGGIETTIGGETYAWVAGHARDSREAARRHHADAIASLSRVLCGTCGATIESGDDCGAHRHDGDDPDLNSGCA